MGANICCIRCEKIFRAYGERAKVAQFCSRSCAATLQLQGAGNPRWNGGRTTHESGYILVKAPAGHPHATKAGYIREHRLVAEKTLGRYLLPSEDVHHLDGDKTNNDPNNLEVISDRSEHLRIEHAEGRYAEHLAVLNGSR